MRPSRIYGLFLAVLLLACQKDATPNASLVGTWVREVDEPGQKRTETLTFFENGRCSRETDAVFHLNEQEAAKVGKRDLPSKSSSACTWEIKDGKLVRTFGSPAPYVTTQVFAVDQGELAITVTPKTVERFKKK